MIYKYSNNQPEIQIDNILGLILQTIAIVTVKFDHFLAYIKIRYPFFFSKVHIRVGFGSLTFFFNPNKYMYHMNKVIPSLHVSMNKAIPIFSILSARRRIGFETFTFKKKKTTKRTPEMYTYS